MIDLLLTLGYITIGFASIPRLANVARESIKGCPRGNSYEWCRDHHAEGHWGSPDSVTGGNFAAGCLMALAWPIAGLFVLAWHRAQHITPASVKAREAEQNKRLEEQRTHIARLERELGIAS